MVERKKKLDQQHELPISRQELLSKLVFSQLSQAAT
jgi:hypothetical protein